MDEAEFDRYALTYEEQHRKNIEVTGEDPSFFAEYKIRLFSEWTGLQSGNIIDFGSGIGNSVPHFRNYFDGLTVTCADISQKSLDYATRTHPGSEASLKITPDGIPAPDASFDAAFSACVLPPYSPFRTRLLA